ncbi:RHS repeat-associated core domain-containing protein, partial [Pectobacterium parmentieri]
YGYDAADNLQDSGHSLSALPLSDNRLLNWRHLWNQYDGQGNLIRRREGSTEQFYRYDADNRLVEARGRGPQGEFVARYGYDALGRRTRKTVTWGDNRKQEETRFLWEGFRLLQARHADRTESYVYDPTIWWSPLARITQQPGGRDGDIRWFNTELNGAPLEMTDAEGAVRWSGDYGSFGAVNGQTQDSEGLRHGKSVESQSLRYAGQYADEETGLHYNLFRYYDPTVGRFTTQDPIGLRGGLNLYSYAPNPLGWIDPLGLTGTPLEKGAPLSDATKVYRISTDGPYGFDFNPREIDAINNGKLNPPGVSVIRANSADEATRIWNDAFPKRPATSVGEVSAADLRKVGFDVIHDPSGGKLGANHARLIHPEGVDGFNAKKGKLSGTFKGCGG